VVYKLLSGVGVPIFKLLPSQLLIGWKVSFSLVEKKLARGKLWQNPRDELQNIELYQSSAKALHKAPYKALPKALPKALSKALHTLPT